MTAKKKVATKRNTTKSVLKKKVSTPDTAESSDEEEGDAADGWDVKRANTSACAADFLGSDWRGDMLSSVRDW